MSGEQPGESRRAVLKQIGAVSVGAVGVASATGSAGAVTGSGAYSLSTSGPQIGSVGETSITVTWDGQSDRYVTYWQNTETGDRDFEFVTTTEKTISGLETGTTYRIWVGAIEGRSISWYGPVRATPQQSDGGSGDGSGGSDGGGSGDGSDGSDGSDSDSFARQVEQKIHEKVNERRQERGLDTLSYRDDIATVARDHSQYQADNNTLTHVQSDGDRPGDRLREDGIRCRAWGENVYSVSNYAADESAEAAAERCVSEWMKSDGHRANILGDYALEGVGVVTTDDGRLYATQVFGTNC